MRYRIEKDSLGEKQIPAEAYYGIYTLRSKENFDITKRGLPRQMIKTLALLKKSAAVTNNSLGLINNEKMKAISLSSDEILNGRLHGQFITDLIQGGNGIAMDMNANEVIANRANEMMGGKKGVYDYVDPLIDVAKGQNSEDIILSASKLACIRQTKKLLVEIKKLSTSISKKSNTLKDIKVEYTNRFTTNSIYISEKLDSISMILDRDYKAITIIMGSMYELGFENNDPKFSKKMVSNIAKFTGEPFVQAKSLVDVKHNIDCFSKLSNMIKTLDVNLSKAFDDLIFINNNINKDVCRIIIPSIQSYPTPIYQDYSTFDILDQVSKMVIGLDSTINMAIDDGLLQENKFRPLIVASLFDELNISRRVIRTIREKIIDDFNVEYAGIEAL